MPKKVTIHDVARHAGVSHTTVSWAIHDDPRITVETKQKVLKSVEALDYFPAFLGRSLVGGHTKTIAVVAASFSTLFEMELIRGVEEALEAGGDEYTIQLYSSNRDKNSRMKTFQKILQGRRADAVITVNLRPGHTFIEEFRDSGVSLVLVEDLFENVSSVYCDSTIGARKAVEHLIDRGCKKPGLLVGYHNDPLGSLSPKARYDTYIQVMNEREIAVDEKAIVEIPSYHPEEAIMTFRRFMDAGCDGIFCAAGDLVALGLLKAARQQNISIPDDMRIVGYDDVTFSSLTNPALTTIHQPLGKMGATAYELCVRGIAAEKEHSWFAETVRLEPELIIRESS